MGDTHVKSFSKCDLSLDGLIENMLCAGSSKLQKEKQGYIDGCPLRCPLTSASLRSVVVSSSDSISTGDFSV